MLHARPEQSPLTWAPALRRHGTALRLPGARGAGVRGVGATESGAADALRPQTWKSGARVGAIVGAVFVRRPRCAAMFPHDARRSLLRRAAA
jgi:hypothetical protein